MRAMVAKRIRRQVYGSGHHLGPVLYYKDSKGTTTSDTARQRYKLAKQRHKEKNK